MAVHNHGIDPSCQERKVGECLLKPGVVVLDLDKWDDEPLGSPLLDRLRRVVETGSTDGHARTRDIIGDIADQIEEQTKPARIPEPGRYGVVRASGQGLNDTEWVNEGKWWISMDESISPHRRWAEWHNLIDPVLIREGVE